MPVSATIATPESVDQIIPTGPQHWTGPAEGRFVAQALGASETSVNMLVFQPGTRSRPHRHSFEQILLYTSGRGLVAVDGGEDQIVETGQFVLLPANVVHMHGATDDGPASHVSITVHGDTDFDCPVPEQWARWRR